MKGRLRRLRSEIGHTLVFCLADLEPSDALEHHVVRRVTARLPDKDDELERLQIEIRYCLTLDASLARILGDATLSDRVIRQLLFALEVEIESRLTGEPKRLLPFDIGGFRGMGIAAEAFCPECAGVCCRSL